MFQNEAAEEVKKEEKKKLALLQDQDLSQYAIKGSEQDWGTALAAGKQGLVSVKRSVLYHRSHADDKIRLNQFTMDFFHLVLTFSLLAATCPLLIAFANSLDPGQDRHVFLNNF